MQIRSKPISGVITDEYGNVLRDAFVSIKLISTNKSIEVDTTRTDDGGRFTTRPLPNGKYGVFVDSGMQAEIHDHYTGGQFNIPCYEALSESLVGVSLNPFEGPKNDFVMFLQIEDNTVDVGKYGNTYPLISPIKKPSVIESMNWESAMHTTSLFNIEYYYGGRRSYWKNVPAVQFGTSSRLVIPLSYYNIGMDYPKAEIVVSSITGSGDLYTVLTTSSPDVRVGDVLSIGLIVVSIASGALSCERWLGNDVISDNMNPVKCYVYGGMFLGINRVSYDLNERFSITESTERGV